MEKFFHKKTLLRQRFFMQIRNLYTIICPYCLVGQVVGPY